MLFLFPTLAAAFTAPQLARPSFHSRHTSPHMDAPSWYQDLGATLPIIVSSINEALLLGESRPLVFEKAEELAAIDVAQQEHGCLAQLIRTPQDNALAAAPLLEIREVRKRKVGATVEVVCVGRVKVEKVDAEGRSLVGTKVLPLRDSELKGVVVHAADEDLVDAVSAAAARHRCLLEKLEEDLYDEECEAEDDAEECLPKKWPAVHDAFRGVVVPTTTPSNAILSSKGFGGGPQQREQFKEGEEEAEEERAAARALELAAERLTEELCSIDLDLPPLDSLERLHKLWGVNDESQAEEQVLSFAACATLSAWRRAQALGITNTAERLEMAQKGLDRMSKEAAAKLALRGALA